MAACALTKAKALAVFLITCMPVCGHDPVVVAAAADSSDQPDLLRKISDVELILRDLRDQVQAISMEANARNSAGKAGPRRVAPAKSPDMLEASIVRWREWSNAHLSRLLLSDGVFWLSILAILQWHVRFHLGEFIWGECPRRHPWLRKYKKPFLFPRKLGMHVLILVLYYDTDLPVPNWLYDHVNGHVFLVSIFLIFFDAFALHYGFMLLGWSLMDRHPEKSRRAWQNPLDSKKEDGNPLDSKEEDGIPPPKYKATNIYEDFTRRFGMVFPTFIAQLFLVTLYMQKLNSDSRTHDAQFVNFNYWVGAVIFSIYAGDGQVGEAFNERYWYLVLLRSQKSSQSADQCGGLISYALQFLGLDSANMFELISRSNGVGGINGGEEERRRKQEVEEKHLKESFDDVGVCWHRIFTWIPVKFIYEWHLRRVMDVVINSLSRSVILYTVPIMVSVEEPLDFVKDLTAVMFITVLDNIEDSRSLKEILVKLKFGLFFERDERQDVPVSAELERAVELKDEERQHVEENWEQYRDISTMAPEKWDAFLGRGPANSRRSPSRNADSPSRLQESLQATR